MRIALALSFAVVWLTAQPAGAQEAIATAIGAPPAPEATAAAGPIVLSSEREHDDRGPAPVGPCGGGMKVGKDGALAPDKSPHGEVFAGVGTSNYREAGGVVCIPLGDNAHVTVAVDAGRIGRR